MKHKLLAFLIVTFIAANLSCTNSKGTRVIPFADPNLKQAVIDAIKKTDPAYSATDVKVADCQKLPKQRYQFEDGTTAELIMLDASNRCITDVAGIQYCSNLQELDLGNNQLTSLSAGVFTGLTNLQVLYLSNNQQLAILPTGIFSGLTKLTYLDLSNVPLIDLAPLSTLHKAGGLPKGSTIEIDKFPNSKKNRNIINSLEKDGVYVFTTVTGWNLEQ